jgi:hypothetical protein
MLEFLTLPKYYENDAFIFKILKTGCVVMQRMVLKGRYFDYVDKMGVCFEMWLKVGGISEF